MHTVPQRTCGVPGMDAPLLGLPLCFIASSVCPALLPYCEVLPSIDPSNTSLPKQDQQCRRPILECKQHRLCSTRTDRMQCLGSSSLHP